jgi:hypothetical protein
MTIAASPAADYTDREERAIALYRARASEIREVWMDVFEVPSCTGTRTYTVDYEHETCTCPDFTITGEVCKHILAVGILYAKTHRRVGLQDHPHACVDGIVYLTYTDENGEEAVEAVPCRRCAEAGKGGDLIGR